MERKRLITIVLITVAMVAALALAAGCQSKPTTLEEYFKQHESE